MWYPFLIVRRDQFHEDGWTYGDWRQYIVEFPDGRTRCARLAGGHYILALIAFMFGASFALMMATFPPEQIAWERAIPVTALCFLYIVALLVFDRMGYRLMKAVGPYNDGDRRVYPGEEKRRG